MSHDPDFDDDLSPEDRYDRTSEGREWAQHEANQRQHQRNIGEPTHENQP